MADCVIFCAGGFSGLVEPIATDACILAADGGFAHVQSLGLTPTEILGDFDSLGYVPQGAQVFPVEKDDTDAMLAARRGLELGCHRFLFYGAMDGERIDHTVANFQTLQFLADKGCRGYLIGQKQIATVVKNDSLRFSRDAAGIFSVFCLGADARGVTLRGVKYPLENGTLTAGFPLGVSNHFVGEAGEITVTDGSLLVIYDRVNGIEVGK